MHINTRISEKKNTNKGIGERCYIRMTHNYIILVTACFLTGKQAKCLHTLDNKKQMKNDNNPPEEKQNPQQETTTTKKQQPTKHEQVLKRREKSRTPRQTGAITVWLTVPDTSQVSNL